jgi:hypothetical protein
MCFDLIIAVTRLKTNIYTPLRNAFAQPLEPSSPQHPRVPFTYASIVFSHYASYCVLMQASRKRPQVMFRQHPHPLVPVLQPPPSLITR